MIFSGCIKLAASFWLPSSNFTVAFVLYSHDVNIFFCIGATSSSSSTLSTSDANSCCTDGEVSISIMDQNAYSSDSGQEVICLSSDEEWADHPSQEIIPAVCRIMTPSKSIDDIYQAMKGLDTAEKYSLLFNHVRPPTTDHLPSTHSHGCDTKFRVEWLA